MTEEYYVAVGRLVGRTGVYRFLLQDIERHVVGFTFFQRGRTFQSVDQTLKVLVQADTDVATYTHSERLIESPTPFGPPEVVCPVSS